MNIKKLTFSGLLNGQLISVNPKTPTSGFKPSAISHQPSAISSQRSAKIIKFNQLADG
jgi:hypothetical protein